MIKIAVVTGSTRPGRKSKEVAQWLVEQAESPQEVQLDLVDIADFQLPLLDEAMPPMMKSYSQEHSKKWSQTISGYDGFIFVTPEYNHSTSAALKNALDYLYYEWNNKAAAFVSYGSMGGLRAVEHLRAIAGELQMADVQNQVSLSIFSDWVNFSEFKPADSHKVALQKMLSQLIPWAKAMKGLREQE